MPYATQKRPEIVENITVLKIGEFGVLVDEKTWFGVNEPLTPQSFTKGSSYKVSVTVSKTGKKYVSAILGVEDNEAPAPATTAKAAAPAATAPKAESKAPAKSTATDKDKNPTRAGFGQPLTDYDMAVQRQISRAGIYQAALSSPVLGQWVANADEYIALVRKVADAGIEYIKE